MLFRLPRFRLSLGLSNGLSQELGVELGRSRWLRRVGRCRLVLLLLFARGVCSRGVPALFAGLLSRVRLLSFVWLLLTFASSRLIVGLGRVATGALLTVVCRLLRGNRSSRFFAGGDVERSVEIVYAGVEALFVGCFVVLVHSRYLLRV
ncbi:MAG TPA: hypothetical protein VKZ43_10015 [Trueperaceae bacterium]|nr:hypothetical protein [Trueperaceae bacterium]